MRLLYLHPNAWSGEYQMLLTLRDLGHEVCALEERRDMAASRRVDEHFRIEGDGIRTFWYHPGRGLERLLTWPLDRFFRRSFEGRNLVHRMWIIRAAVRHFKPDALIASDGFSYGIPASFLKQLGLLETPLLQSYIGGDILDCPEADVGKRRTGLTGWMIRTALRGPETLRPVSPLVRDELIGAGADLARIVVIPSHLVLDPTRLEKLRDDRASIRRRVRAALGIAESAPVIVTLGGNQKGKGLHLLASAWPAVLREFPLARWVLCGPDHPWLDRAVWPALARAAAEQSGGPSPEAARAGVVTTGWLNGDAVFEHFLNADLHVNPSLCESLNMATVEAAAVGTPSVCSDGAGIVDWIRRHDAGVVVPRQKIVPLGDAIIAALRSPEIRARWSESCLRLAAEFAPQRIARDLIGCLAPPGSMPPPPAPEVRDAPP